MSAPLFKNILEKNKAIKGRLTFNKKDLEELYLALQKDNNRLKKTYAFQEQVIKSNITKRKKINLQIKQNLESVLKSFYPSKNKISLLYKKQSEFYYIKARFYWRGKQREVQVGSIPNVIAIINSMIVNKLLPGVKVIRVKELTWEQIHNRSNVIDGVKEIASLKAQEYILRRLMKERLHNIDDFEDNVHYEEDINLDSIENEQSSIKPEPVNDKADELIEGVEWYKQWRKDNL